MKKFKIELKHFATYLLHNVKGEYFSSMAGIKVYGEMSGISTSKSYECVDMVSLDLIDMIHIEDVKLFLVPIDNLTKEEAVNLGWINESDLIRGIEDEKITISDLEYLASNHYDIYGLIDEGLANKLNI